LSTRKIIIQLMFDTIGNSASSCYFKMGFLCIYLKFVFVEGESSVSNFLFVHSQAYMYTILLYKLCVCILVSYLQNTENQAQQKYQSS